MPRLVLASASAARRSLLLAAGLAPEVIVSDVDETGVQGPVADVCRILAERKAAAVAARLTGQDTLVLGCDSLLELDGAALGKPATAAEATGRWVAMAGRTGTLHTGHCLIDVPAGRRVSAVSSTLVRFGRPDPAELAAYVATGEPLGLAGAFSIDGRAAPFVEGIDGDPGTVIGLSLPTLRRLLGELGHRITDLWVAPDGAR